MKILVTGGAGFIGSSVVRKIINETTFDVVNLDCLTYAGNLESLHETSQSDRYSFEKIDITNKTDLIKAFEKHKPTCVMHLAAESHVDRSISSPNEFIYTNIIGTFNLLETSMDYYQKLNSSERNRFRFHHISTDEVYGDLEDNISKFTENTSYAPSSPYSSSKAASDHLVRAWHRTYNLPALITNCSNNYGPFQYPEKLIPNIIINALNHNEILIYGDGNQIRDWLYVEDHANALLEVILNASPGDNYNIGGNNEKKNIDVVNYICKSLDKIRPTSKGKINSYRELIRHVEDRPGHDRRYAIDSSKIMNELNWKPIESFESGIDKTIKWYLNNKEWWNKLLIKK